MLFRVIFFVILPVFVLTLGAFMAFRQDRALAAAKTVKILKWIAIALGAAIVTGVVVAGIFQLEHLI